MRLVYILSVLFAVCALGDTVEFNRDVRPILSDRCFACHGTDAPARKIKLRLDQESTARQVVSSGELVRRITATDGKKMPPVWSGQKLSEAEIRTLEAWAAAGAPWQQHWSLISPKRPELPEVQRRGWVRNPIDHFVLARLEKEGIEPSPEAPKRTLIRRVSLSLTGLPPTPAEVDAFLRDERPDAYEHLVDRLLASPRYAEHMAIRWLDASRYADTNGYQTDAERHMWRWRDWVIEAFRTNKPYDKFVIEQIAGDLLPDATLDQKIATGFNRNHRGNSEGGIVPEEYLVEYAVDRVETMSTVFLGSTIGCARCHNHKYDPFTQRDFYSLMAYFNNIPELGRYLKYGNTPPYVQAPLPEQQKELDKLTASVDQARGKYEALQPALEKGLSKWKPATQDWSPADGLELLVPLEDSTFDGKHYTEAGDYGRFGFYSKFSVSAFIEPTVSTGPIVSRAELTPEGEGWAFELVDGKLQANLIKRRLDDSIRIETEDKLAPGAHHVAMSYDGSRVATGVRIYVDGKPAKLKIILDAINQDFLVKEPLRVGAGGSADGRFKGSISGVHIYKRALLPEE
ncbi:MAG TPA: DUF1549 domain-containing protein, partial [Bryobacteraceae bacterium]|nr:DUF1549 domain-containing protein [Bryobacteraceae bacterium]